MDGVTVRANGKAELAYVGDTPWHGKGDRLAPGAPHEEWLVASGLNYRINRTKVQFQPEGRNSISEMCNREVLYRSDTEAPLSVVSNGYQIVQPEEVLKYFDDLCQHLDFQLDTAGSLFGGREYWALATIGPEAKVLDTKDKMKGRLLVVSSCDGTKATTGRFVCERVVCANTMAVALHEPDGTVFRVRHAQKFDPAILNRALGIDMKARFQEHMANFRRLANTKMSPVDLIKATVEVFRPDAHTLPAAKLARVVRSQQVRRIFELVHDRQLIGQNMQGMHGTAWGLVNGFTQFIDWENGSRSIDRRLERAWFGLGNQYKRQALAVALDHADGNALSRHNYNMPDDDLLTEALQTA